MRVLSLHFQHAHRSSALYHFIFISSEGIRTSLNECEKLHQATKKPQRTWTKDYLHYATATLMYMCVCEGKMR